MNDEINKLRALMLNAERMYHDIAAMASDVARNADLAKAFNVPDPGGLLTTIRRGLEVNAKAMNEWADHCCGYLIEEGHKLGLTDEQTIGSEDDATVPGTMTIPMLRPTYECDSGGDSGG